MTDHLSSSKYCLGHAKRRIDELIRTIDAFVKTNPCKSIIEHDADTGEGILKVKLVKPMPAEIPGFVFDAINNLRAALDHAGFATSIAAGHPGDHAHFPFGDTRSEIIGRQHTGRSRELHEEIFKIMVDCQPYRGGDDILWALNKLCNRNKHEIVIPYAIGEGLLAFSISRTLNPVKWGNKRWDRTKNEKEVARIASGAQFQDHVNLISSVIFDEFPVIGLRPVDNVLREMFTSVGHALQVIEARANDIGLFK